MKCQKVCWFGFFFFRGTVGELLWPICSTAGTTRQEEAGNKRGACTLHSTLLKISSHHTLASDSCLCFTLLSHRSGAAKLVGAGLLTVGGGVGGTILYAKWDHKFRAAVESNVPYADWLLGLALGPASQDHGLPFKKQVRMGSQHVWLVRWGWLLYIRSQWTTVMCSCIVLRF